MTREPVGTNGAALQSADLVAACRCVRAMGDDSLARRGCRELLVRRCFICGSFTTCSSNGVQNREYSPMTPANNAHTPNPSGNTVPIWYSVGEPPRRRPVEADISTDVCIVGGGIAGLTTAYYLAKEGRSVVVVDEKPVGGGETGRTSAHLSSALDDRFHELEGMHGLDAVRLLYESHAVAIDEIERVARDEAIECDFTRIDGFLFAGEGVDHDTLDKEFAAAQRAGVRGVEMLEMAPAKGIPAMPCIRFPLQARFHPLKYVFGLATVLERLGVRIHTGDRVMDLAGDGPVIAKLSSGRVVTASAGVAATNIPTPINNWVGIYTKEAPYRTYVLGIEAQPGAVSDALYWDMVDPYHYVRLERHAGRDIVLVGGEDHKTGQAGEGGEASHFDKLEAWARAWCPSLGSVVSRWSGQVSEPDDGVAFIGRVPTKGHEACYVITGDSGMGLTHATLGAKLVADLIAKRSNPWSEVYDPGRKPWKAPGAFVKENVNAVAQMGDYLKRSDVETTASIAPGEGAVVRDGLSLLAVYRNPEGALHTTSAVCPHLKCVVRWNNSEKSWDCPCHGSRFTAEGKLIMGPAVDDLSPHAAPSETK